MNLTSNANNYKSMGTAKMASNNSFLITNANLNPSYLSNESRNRTSKLINSQLPLQDTINSSANNYRYQMISSGNSDVPRNAVNSGSDAANSGHGHQQHQKIVYINNSSNKNAAGSSTVNSGSGGGNGSNRFPLEALNKIDTTASLLNFRVKSAQNLAKQRSTGN